MLPAAPAVMNARHMIYPVGTDRRARIRMIFSQIKMCFDPYFDCLIDQHYKNDDQRGYGGTAFEHRVWRLVYFFFCEFLASTLRVAWGTARSRSLGISSPVSQQTP